MSSTIWKYCLISVDSALLCWVLLSSEELRHLIGTETTRQGVMLVFNMFQHPKLNRRLVYVVLEGLLTTIFPDNKFEETFRKLHSQSPRIRKQNKQVPATGGDTKRASRKRCDWIMNEIADVFWQNVFAVLLWDSCWFLVHGKLMNTDLFWNRRDLITVQCLFKAGWLCWSV